MKVFDKPRAALHLRHLLSRLFLHQSSVHVSHPFKIEQFEQAIIGAYTALKSFFKGTNER